MAERIRAQLMQTSELDLAPWKSVDPRFGSIPGVPVGRSWENRSECAKAGAHTQTIAGISPHKQFGAFSIVLAAGYEDDIDEGEAFTYTGTGGQADSAFGASGPQVQDQSFDHPHNAALKKSVDTQYPVRVVRGPNPQSRYAPVKGYRYDGLYKVEQAYLDKGKSGYAICRYLFRRLPGQPPLVERQE